ncbi:MAG TPA: hypothetical protein VEA79_09480 [Phenylobacterium sp.]|nr:hypothetical protein [Phenylobacterium sp.]
MFELGQGLRRLLGKAAPADGLTGGDAGLLELLDLSLLQREARAADVAAGRISARDRAMRLLEAAGAWREVARRTGDALALRKAAATAEAAAVAFDRKRRPQGWARARALQAACALLGAELFGDEGLDAAAGVALADARGAARGVTLTLIEASLALVDGRKAFGAGDAQGAADAAARLAGSLRDLGAAGRSGVGEAARIELALAHADLMAGIAGLAREPQAARQAIKRLDALALDEAYAPVSAQRALALKASLLTLTADLGGRIEPAAEAVETATRAVAVADRDHSPLDWARAQAELAHALQALGEATLAERTLELAVTAYERADMVLRRTPRLALRAALTANRAACLARQAELTGDLAILDAAEIALKTELTGGAARRDAVAWALAQTQLGQLYLARAELTGRREGAGSAGLALSAALDVFGEQGLRAYAAAASQGLERLRALA